MAMTTEERKARDAERKRISRAAAAAERDAARADTRTSSASAAGTTMRDAVDEALTAAKWLTGSDAASIAQAKTIARRIDLLEHDDESARALSAHRALSQILNDLGVTATKRLQYELRSLKQATKSEGDDESDSNGGVPAGPGNVTKFERPAKRGR